MWKKGRPWWDSNPRSPP